MQCRQIAFKQNMFVVGAGDIARTTRTCAAAIQCFMHGIQHIRVLTHAKVVIRTPHRYLTTNTLVMACGAREFAAATFQIGKDAVSALTAKAIKLPLEEFLVIHVTFSLPRITFQVLRLCAGRFRYNSPKKGPTPCLW